MRSSFDPFQHVSMQMKVLDFIGLSFRIPHSKRSLYFWRGVAFRVCIGVFVFVIPTTAQIVYLTRLMLSGNAEVQSVAAIVNLVMTEILTDFKLLDMCLRREKLELLFKQFHSKEFQHDSDPCLEISERALKISRHLFLFFISIGSLDIIVHVIVVPGLGRFESLPLKMDFIFFDVNDPKYFNYICAYQIMYKPWMVTAFALLLSLRWAAMSFTISQLDILIYNFENMKELVKVRRSELGCDENEAFRRIFKGCVIHHLAIKRFINTLQAVFSLQLASSLCLNTAILGTTAMQFLSIESPLKNWLEVLWVSTYLIIFTLMLFVDCYFGNSITVKCVQLSTKVYESPWLNLDIKLKKSLVLFLRTTQQPVIVLAAKRIPVALDTFTKVMNWTYQGFAVLNQMK